MMPRPLIRRELRDALRRYWFLVNAALFVVAGLLLILFGQPDAILLGSRGYARSLAGLMQLGMVLLPLMALVPAIAAIAGEREAGTLDYLLAQPVTRGQVYVGKWAGVASASVLSVIAGFGVVGTVASARGVPSAPVAALLGFTILLVVAFVSLGLWISSQVASQTKATSLGMTAWLVLAGLGSLGVMSAFVQWGLPAWLLQTWSIANPVEAYRLAGIVILDPETTALGPVGDSLLDSAGRNGVIALAAGSLVGWAAGAFVLGLSAFRSLERGFPTSSHGPRPTDGMVAPGSTLALVDERVKLEGGRRR